jgi:hypothetical protein
MTDTKPFSKILPLFLKYFLTTGKGVDAFLLFLLVCSQDTAKGERAERVSHPEIFLFFLFSFHMKDFIVVSPQFTALEKVKKIKREE